MTEKARDSATRTLKDRAPVVLGGLAIYGGALLVGALLGQNATGGMAMQAVVAEIGAGRLAVTWSDPHAPPAPPAAIALRFGRGAARGAILGLVVVVFAVLANGATVTFGRPSLAQATLGVVMASLVAVRDELLFRGVVLRAFDDLSPVLRILVCALAAGAARAGFEPCTPIEAAAAAAFGAAMAALWLSDRGAWLPLGAHVVYRTVLGPLIHGGLADVRPSAGAWGGGTDLEGGLAALLPLVFLAVALAWTSSRRPKSG